MKKAAVFCLFFIALSNYSNACSCRDFSLEEAYKDFTEADQVYVATVISAKFKKKLDESNPFPSLVEGVLRTEEVFKGNPRKKGKIYEEVQYYGWTNYYEDENMVFESSCGTNWLGPGLRLIVFKKKNEKPFLGFCGATAVWDSIRENEKYLFKLREWSKNIEK